MDLTFTLETDYSADIVTYKRTRARLLTAEATESDEKAHIAAMVRDCDYIIQWLETGRRPGNKRGVERLAAYQREIPMELMERYAQPQRLEIGEYDEWQYQKAEYILSMLTDRERECYELNIGGLYSEREIARMLGITGPAVHDNLKRAKNKIRRYKAQPLPMILAI